MTYRGPNLFYPDIILYICNDTLELIETTDNFLRYKSINSNNIYKIVFSKYNNEIKHFIINSDDAFKISFVSAVNLINKPLTEYMYKYLTDKYDHQFQDDLINNFRIQLDEIVCSDIYQEMIILDN